MAPPVKKAKTVSSDNRRLISENQQQPMGSSLMESVGNRRSSRLKMKKKNRKISCWMCNDVLMDILPFFGLRQLGLKLALISPRFDGLVDKHFNAKSELTLWRPIEIKRSIGLKPKLFVYDGGTPVRFPLPDHSLPNKIRFKDLDIYCIVDHSVVAFLRANQQIFDRNGTNLRFPMTYESKSNNKTVWDVFARKIWPIFAPNIRRLYFQNAVYLDNLCRLISPTLLTDLNQLDSIHSGTLFPADHDDDGPNAATPSAGQALAKWLHAPPRTDGQPKRLYCHQTLSNVDTDIGWINDFKETFLRATTASFSASARYTIQFDVNKSLPIGPFELVNERTQERLTLWKGRDYGHVRQWVMKRCPIGETAIIQWEAPKNSSATNLNNVNIYLCCVSCCTG